MELHRIGRAFGAGRPFIYIDSKGRDIILTELSPALVKQLLMEGHRDAAGEGGGQEGL